LIKLFTDPGEIVLDCFIGSGTTAVAALSETRQYVGIDKESKSVKIARKAVASFNDHKKESVQMELMIREIEAIYNVG
jgi:site-specific DNA-methyltransferase (adenine-specific)